MDRKLDRTAASNPDFLRRGNTWAVLNAGRKQHSLKDVVSHMGEDWCKDTCRLTEK